MCPQINRYIHRHVGVTICLYMWCIIWLWLTLLSLSCILSWLSYISATSATFISLTKMLSTQTLVLALPFACHAFCRIPLQAKSSSITGHPLLAMSVFLYCINCYLSLLFISGTSISCISLYSPSKQWLSFLHCFISSTRASTESLGL
jgi:hypothetical protein